MRFFQYISGLNVWKTALYGLFSVLVIFGNFSYNYTAEATFPSHKLINASISDYSCDDSEWHFVITRIDRDNLAPQSIEVSLENGVNSVVFLDSVTGGTAHYRTTENLDSIVVGASANIYFKWAGQFNLSHGPCDESPPPPPVFECSDQLDNDGDGAIDYPQDEGCDDLDDDDENNAPVITILGDNPFTLTVGDDFIDPKATADDPEDGDITSQIVIGGDAVATSTSGTYVVTYNVSDSDGVAADEKTRIVEVEDKKLPPPDSECSDQLDNDGDSLTDSEDSACHTDGDPENPDSYNPDIDDENEPPVITLLGDNPFTLTVGDDFIDPKATADDPEDGDITSQIVIGGDAVATSTPGTYTITYDVSDSEGKSADQAVRTVIVEEEETNNGNGGGPSGGGNGGGGSSGGGGGGGTSVLTITNEDIEATGSSSVRVTWQTNLNATTWTVYDTTSHATGTESIIEYSASSTYTHELMTDHSITVTGLTAGVRYYFRPVSERSILRAIGKELTIVLGENGTTTVVQTVTPIVCEEYLKSYIKIGEINDQAEVVKLQLFLKNFEGFSDISVTGVYDQASFEAVSEFQERYRTDVLDPWGLEGPTGYVYYTTKKKINEIYCDSEFPLTSEQLAEIEEYRLLVETFPPGETIDTGSVGLEEELPDGGSIGLLEESQEEDTDDSLLASVGEEEGGSSSGSVLGNLAAAAVSFSEKLSWWVRLLILAVVMAMVWLFAIWFRRGKMSIAESNSPSPPPIEM